MCACVRVCVCACVRMYVCITVTVWFAADWAADLAGPVHISYPLFDYVPPELVNLFIFNMYARILLLTYLLLLFMCMLLFCL